MHDLKGTYTEGVSVMLNPDPAQYEREIVVMDLAVLIDGVAEVSIDFAGGQNILFTNVNTTLWAEKQDYRFRAGGTDRNLTITVTGAGTVRTYGRAVMVHKEDGHLAWTDEEKIPE